MSRFPGWRLSRQLLVLLLASVLTLLAGCAIFSTQPECQDFTVPNAAMEPTLHQGQIVVIDTLAYRSSSPKRGNIVLVKEPSNPNQQEILRVIGLPGETVRLSATQTFINGKELSEPFVLHRGTQQPMEVTLQPGEYFLMGDNRPESVDSRAWGPVPLNHILGQMSTQYCPNS